MLTDDELRYWLSDEYGIDTMKELDKAIRNMKKVNIGIFTTPVKEVNSDEAQKCS